MANDKNIKRIEANSSLNKHWINFLKAQGLARAYAAARSDKPHATLGVVNTFTGAEKKAFPGLLDVYNDEFERISNIYHAKIAKAKGVHVVTIYDVLSADMDLAKKTDAVIQKSPEWKKAFKVFQHTVLEHLNTLADLKKGAFAKSDFFKTWLESNLQPRKIADLLKLQKFKKTDILTLGQAFVLNDTGTMTQAAKNLEKSGLRMKPAEVANLLQSKFGKLRL